MKRGAVLGIRRTPTDVERGGCSGGGRRNHRVGRRVKPRKRGSFASLRPFG